MDRGNTFYLRLLSIVSLALFLSSCGRPFKDRYNSLADGYTKVEMGSLPPQDGYQADLTQLFSSGQEDPLEQARRVGIFTAPTVDAIVWALSTSNASYIGRSYFSGSSELGSSSTKVWTIPNGNYVFSMLGYGAASMGGTPICALASASSGGSGGDVISLIGGGKTIYFTGASCGTNNQFRDASYSTMSIAVCSESAYSHGSTSTPCTTPAAGYVRILVNPIDEFTGLSTSSYTTSATSKLASACTALSSGIATGFNFVAGNSSYTSTVKLRAEVAYYTDSSCSTLHSLYAFGDGLAAATALYAGSSVASLAATSNTYVKFVTGSSPRLFLQPIP